MATIKEVARRARVSVGTVSNVLSGAVPVSERLKQRVERVIRELDYHPNHVARSLKIRQTMMLGMVVSDLTNSFFPLVVRGAEDAAWAHNYMLITLNSDDRPERELQALSALRTRRVDGLLLVAAATDGDLSHIKGMINAGIPVVCIDRAIATLPVDCVSVDNVAGVRMGVEHLLELGHRRIGILTGPLTVQLTRDRLEGYRQALAAAGIAMDESLVRTGPNFRAESGYAESLVLLREQRPTAVFSTNAMLGLGLLRAINELNMKCPEEVSIVTFDDPVFAQSVRPELTCVAQPAYDIGFRGARMLIERLMDPARTCTHVLLDTELRTRQSTAPVPVAAVR
jgi:LacI family transcriptional regulator